MLSDGESLANFWCVPDSEEGTIKDFTGQQNICSFAGENYIYFTHTLADGIYSICYISIPKEQVQHKVFNTIPSTVSLNSLWNHNHTSQWPKSWDNGVGWSWILGSRKICVQILVLPLTSFLFVHLQEGVVIALLHVERSLLDIKYILCLAKFLVLRRQLFMSRIPVPWSATSALGWKGSFKKQMEIYFNMSNHDKPLAPWGIHLNLKHKHR